MKERFESSENIYNKISPTAWSVAYGRTFTDIPFSNEIYSELKNDNPAFLRLEKDGMLSARPVAVQFEARYKLINKLTKLNGQRQILELASGLSPRGMELSSQDCDVFVETDLPEMIDLKNDIVRKVLHHKNIALDGRLFIEHGNAIEPGGLAQAASHFKPNEHVCVITEGLLRYLDFDEKTKVAKNVISVLNKYGGYWLTSDTQTLADVPESHKTDNAKFSKLVGREISKNYFETPKHAEDFFENLGFTVKPYSFSEIEDCLVSPMRLGLDKKTVNEELSKRRVFLMRLKESNENNH